MTAIPTAPPAEGDVVVNPLTQSEAFSVKILLKEKSYDVGNLTPSTTIAALKSAIESATDVPPPLQRLIAAGKQLKPDTKTLLDFKIVAGASIHLFPLPPPSQATPVATAVENGATSNVVQVWGAPAHNNTGGGHQPIHFDPFINQTAREVRLWCLILMFLSGMTLFNNLSYMAATGKLGSGTLDSFVTIIDTVCSGMGLIVANMGIQALRSMDPADVGKYVQSLISLALLSVSLRILWVVDMILQVKKAVKKSQEEKGDKNDTIDQDDPNGFNDQPMDSKTVVSFAIQAVIIALICMFAWGSCVSRARRLQEAVNNYQTADAGAVQV
eukprot:CAMPEP_0184981400 /NCGR_PEP_ID=MMETSP1098-20130426/11133_1 /TAXON_ID=89044 /ORGANISM="Spumella elongata, Strain CCAP 955/1" /LENGTH=327 /DNA_ID=CAMNT_0027504959 /DNA_START=162 /DNA_END=1145 /DNA_ORIENTATION=+